MAGYRHNPYGGNKPGDAAKLGSPSAQMSAGEPFPTANGEAAKLEGPDPRLLAFRQAEAEKMGGGPAPPNVTSPYDSPENSMSGEGICLNGSYGYLGAVSPTAAGPQGTLSPGCTFTSDMPLLGTFSAPPHVDPAAGGNGAPASPERSSSPTRSSSPEFRHNPYGARAQGQSGEEPNLSNTFTSNDGLPSAVMAFGNDMPALGTFTSDVGGTSNANVQNTASTPNTANAPNTGHRSPSYANTTIMGSQQETFPQQTSQQQVGGPDPRLLEFRARAVAAMQENNIEPPSLDNTFSSDIGGQQQYQRPPLVIPTSRESSPFNSFSNQSFSHSHNQPPILPHVTSPQMHAVTSPHSHSVTSPPVPAAASPLVSPTNAMYLPSALQEHQPVPNAHQPPTIPHGPSHHLPVSPNSRGAHSPHSSPHSPAGINIVLFKEASEKLPLKWHPKSLQLMGGRQGSNAAQFGVDKCVGMTLARVNDVAVNNAKELASRVNGITSVKLTFVPTPEKKRAGKKDGTEAPTLRVPPAPPLPPQLAEQPPGPEMPFVCTVQFKYGRKAEFGTVMNMQEVGRITGDYWLVEAAKGVDLGLIQSCRVNDDDAKAPQYRLVRAATMAEITVWENDRVEEENLACAFLVDKAKKLKAPVTIHRAEFQYDRLKLTIHYSSAVTKPDFRQLLHDSFREFKCRIWMNNCNPQPGQPGDMLDLDRPILPKAKMS